MSEPTLPRFPMGSPELAQVGAEYVRSCAEANPAAFDGAVFVFAERYANAPRGCEAWHLRIDGRTISAGPGVPDDVDVVIEVDYAVAQRIGSIVVGGDPAAKARSSAIAAEARAAGKLSFLVKNGARAAKAGALFSSDALHDAIAARVVLSEAERQDEQALHG